MDNRIDEKDPRSETLWAAVVALLIGLGLVWVAGV